MFIRHIGWFEGDRRVSATPKQTTLRSLIKRCLPSRQIHRGSSPCVTIEL